MPNHVQNVVKMKGITSLPIFEAVEGYDKKMVMSLDFEKIIPMPESIGEEYSGLEGIAVEAMIRKANASQSCFSKARFRQSMTDTEYISFVDKSGESEEALCRLGLKCIQNLVLYGAANWYDWRIKNWGTKWNSYENVQIDNDTITFYTAWAAPEPVIAQLAKMYPNAEIEHWWADEDIGSNTGYAKYSGGNLVEVMHYDDWSNEAYETYIFCWGESDCLTKGSDGVWHRMECDNCDGCY